MSAFILAGAAVILTRLLERKAAHRSFGVRMRSVDVEEEDQGHWPWRKEGRRANPEQQADVNPCP